MPPWPARMKEVIIPETGFYMKFWHPYHLKLPVRDESILVLVVLLERVEREGGTRGGAREFSLALFAHDHHMAEFDRKMGLVWIWYHPRA